jgi:hypothetical protein
MQKFPIARLPKRNQKTNITQWHSNDGHFISGLFEWERVVVKVSCTQTFGHLFESKAKRSQCGGFQHDSQGVGIVFAEETTKRMWQKRIQRGWNCCLLLKVVILQRMIVKISENIESLLKKG